MAVVATGFFDGVHPGHRLVIDTLLSEARARGEQSVVVTFWPHPRAVLQADADSLRYLTSRSERSALLRSLGVDRVETVAFSREFASGSTADYIGLLRRRFGCTCLVLGYDTRFGAEQAGPEEIAACARAMGIDAVIAPPFCIDGAPVSSSRIRAALEDGDVALATRLLCRPYRLHGVVVSGRKIGRTIGFPTANMKLYEPLMLIPRPGVYATRVMIGDDSQPWQAPGSSASACKCGQSLLKGMTNIGTRPTVNGGYLTIETHILDFDEMIYGLDITVEFHSRIRDEQKFSSLDALRAQLCSDLLAVNYCAIKL